MALAVASGLLLILAYPPFGIPLVAVPSLALLAAALRLAATRQTATTVGMAWAAVFFGIEMHWLPPVLEHSMRLNWLAYLGVVGCLVLLGGLLGAAAWQLLKAGWGTSLAFAIALTGVEWVRAHLGPLSFPWLGVGTAFGSTPALLAPVVWTGERGLTFVVAGLSGALATGGLALAARGAQPPAKQRGQFGMLALVGLWGLACAILGTASPTGESRSRLVGPRGDMGAPVSLAVVTTEFGLPGLIDVEDRMHWIEGALEGWSSSMSDPVDAVVLPEGTVPLVLSQRPDLVNRLAALSQRLGAPVLVGAYGAGDDDTFNSTLLVNGDGIVGRSDKRHKIAVVESGFARGSPAVLGEASLRLGPMICFESLFTDVARELTRAGATVLVNPTSEAWFRNGGTWAAAQHSEHLRSRALEAGRWVIRVANEGESVLFDSQGRVRWRSAGAGVERVHLRARQHTTLYSRVGDGVGLFCGFIVLLLLLTGARPISSKAALNPKGGQLYSEPTEP